MKNLTIKTDLKNRNWLEYIVQEFGRINRAEFDISVVEVADTNIYQNTFYYTQRYLYKKSFYNASDSPLDSLITIHPHDIIVYESTVTNDERFLCPYDIFWNAFVFLSRLEEYESENSGRQLHSYSYNHPRINRVLFDVPVVNYLFNELEIIIREHFPALSFGKKEKPVIELSHDVDYIEKTLRLRIKQTALFMNNAVKELKKPAECLKTGFNALRYFFSNPSYWCFDYWEDIEKSYQKRSVFYVYACTARKDFKSWLIDPSYDIIKNNKLQERLKALIGEGFSIGLHGSIQSAVNESLFKKEKEILETCIDCEVTRSRQHWLRYVENITPYIHNNAIRFDSTLGWNDCMGFRSSCASSYRPYDHKCGRPFVFFEIPQVIMDSNIFDYSIESHEINMLKAQKIVKILSAFKKSHVSISWHQRGCNSDYARDIFYEELLKTLE